jgi:2-polyprenyl-3-methyl-5-hydroxy-6-metoxy-1,4-benzoquinol methylase
LAKSERRRGKHGLSRDLVVAAYRSFLGREPENEEVVREKVEQHKNEEELLNAFLASPEFNSKFPSYGSVVRAQYNAGANPIDTHVSEEKLHRVFERIKQQWTALGRSEPYWSVLSAERFCMKSIQAHEAEFFESGANLDRLIDVFCQRTSVAAPRGTCVELGCGVGRVTRFLSRRFRRVIGVDVSEGNLKLAESYLQKEGATNVSWLLLRELEQLQALEEFDFFFSTIVLQHNPPPVIAWILKLVLRKLRPRGAFLFQVPTQTPGYSFDIDAYLARPEAAGASYEMHALPMSTVLDIIADCGARAKEVVADDMTGDYGSHTFFGVKT